MHRPDSLLWLRVEAEIAAHDADAVVAMPGEIAERTVYPSEQARLDQLEFDLFERATVKLLRDLDLQVAGAGGGDDRVGLDQFVRNRRFEQDVQPGLNSHQADFTVRAV